MKRQLKEAAQEVHDVLGSGWSESIYHRALERELSERGIPFHSEGTISVMYKGAPVGRRRPDLFVIEESGDTVVVELKAGSSSGSDQLSEYLDMTKADENLGRISGGAVIRFNEELEFEYTDASEAEYNFTGYEQINNFPFAERKLFRVEAEDDDVLLLVDYAGKRVKKPDDNKLMDTDEGFLEAAVSYLKKQEL